MLTRTRAYAIVIAACALPRLFVVLYERGALLKDMEKSNAMALLYLKDGTFGFVPGEPSASTQPLYGWFLIAVYWTVGKHWWSLYLVQIAVAVCTALIVFEIGRRFVSLRAGLIAALIATLQPYLIWHDVHGNREILDQPLGAAMFGLALLCAVRPSLKLGAALGVVSGVAILSNTRLVALPIVLALYLLWRHAGWAAAVAVPVLAAVALAPWVIRNKVEVGCWAITTDSRALWKANNLFTYETLASGQWIDNVPLNGHDVPVRTGPDALHWKTPQEAGGYYKEHGVKLNIDECAQETYYEHLVEQFWEHHPGAKAKLMVQATGMLWDPRVGLAGSPNTSLDKIRTYGEPIYMVPLYLLALYGLFCVPGYFRVLALIFVLYETAAAWVFAGTTRYRVPWDFVLALLAAAAIERLATSRSSPFRRPFSQNR
jgi:4-amino-4-deoxy-L-arabinose transferase-like glycosyltransferase